MQIGWTGRVLALVWLACAAAVAAVAVLTMRATPASRATHLGMVLLDLLVAAVVAGPVLRPGVAIRVLRTLGWTLPVVIVWVGVEHYVDWTAFYTSSGPWTIRTAREAQEVGACYVATGLGLLVAYAASMLAHHRRLAGSVTPRTDRLPELVVSPAR